MNRLDYLSLYLAGARRLDNIDRHCQFNFGLADSMAWTPKHPAITATVSPPKLLVPLCGCITASAWASAKWKNCWLNATSRSPMKSCASGVRSLDLTIRKRRSQLTDRHLMKLVVAPSKCCHTEERPYESTHSIRTNRRSTSFSYLAVGLEQIQLHSLRSSESWGL